MQLPVFSPTTFTWHQLPAERIEGAGGYALQQMQHVASVRVRRVVYSAGYLADHWCMKGHFVFVVDGNLTMEYADGSVAHLEKDDVWAIGDDNLAHRASTSVGATVLVLD